MDGIKKSGPVPMKPVSELKTFDELYAQYKALLEYYFDLSVKAQTYSTRSWTGRSPSCSRACSWMTA